MFLPGSGSEFLATNSWAVYLYLCAFFLQVIYHLCISHLVLLFFAVTSSNRGTTFDHCLIQNRFDARVAFLEFAFVFAEWTKFTSLWIPLVNAIKTKHLAALLALNRFKYKEEANGALEVLGTLFSIRVSGHVNVLLDVSKVDFDLFLEILLVFLRYLFCDVIIHFNENKQACC